MGKYLISFQLMVVGMGTVLLTLYFLSLFMRLNSMIWSDKEGDKAENKARIGDDKLSARKVAVISAAVHSFLAEEKRSYRIIAIKRTKSNWKS